ncbi:MAG: hypothetical protein M1272_01020 [Firmicutes bacterium]|nr:hypothetical protein [Bacillota bacterium]
MLDTAWPFGLTPVPEPASGVSRKAAMQWPAYWHYLITNLAHSGGVATRASWSLWFDDATVAKQAWHDAIHDGWWETLARVRGLPECGRLTAEGYAYLRSLGLVPQRRALVPMDSIAFAERVLIGALNATEWRRMTTPEIVTGFYQSPFPAQAFTQKYLERLQHVGNQAVQAGLSIMFWQTQWVWVLLDVRQRQMSWTVNWINRTLRELVSLGATPRLFLLIASPWRQDAWTDVEARNVSRGLDPRITFLFPPPETLDVVRAWHSRSRSTQSTIRPASVSGDTVANDLLAALRAQRKERPWAVRGEATFIGQHS